ncbi:MAG: hypothetical protein JXR37_30275 [Kiritimatiellae bacterium]|nr:hypothetical protein [Kiritimatiellia bacterium]
MSYRRMLLKFALFMGSAGLFSTSALAGFGPLQKDDRILLFDAGTHPVDQIHHRKPQHADDRTVHTRLVTEKGEPFVEFSFTGSRGGSCSKFFFDSLPNPEADKRYVGIQFDIDYRGQDFTEISTTLCFRDNTYLSKQITLEPGRRDYVVGHGYRRATHPPIWEKLTCVWVLYGGRNQVGNPTFRLGSIELVKGQKKETKRPSKDLAIIQVRKAQEILPVAGPVAVDGKLNDPAWGPAAALEDFHYLRGAPVKTGESPFAVRLAYDEKNLYIATRAEFPSAPAVTGDGRFWTDEALEVFFNGHNDNYRKVYFACNGAGKTMTTVRDFSAEAGKIQTHYGASVEETKAMQYVDGQWCVELAFPLSKLSIDLGRDRYAGFHIAQNYMSRPWQPVSWLGVGRYQAVDQWGSLVFNRKPFGPGTITVERIQRIDTGENQADFTIDCAFTGFQPGPYQLAWKVLGCSDELTREPLSVAGETAIRRRFVLKEGRSRHGPCTFYMLCANENGDSRVAAVNFQNELESKSRFADKTLLNPRPKKAAWKEGVFAAARHAVLHLPANATARTRKTAGIFMDKVYGYTGTRLKENRIGPAESPAHGIVLRLAHRAEFDGKPVEPKREGYCLSVTPDRVVITGFDEPGLYYGCVTFAQLLRNSMRITASRPVPCVEIYDWPDLPNRSCRLDNFWAFVKLGEERPIEWVIDWTDRLVAANKINVLICELSIALNYPRRPEIRGGQRIYTPQDLAKLAQYCRDNFIQFCPAWQIGGHASWLLVSQDRLRMKGFQATADFTHPDHNAIVFDCLQDVIDATHPPLICPKMDEMFQKPDPKNKPQTHSGVSVAQMVYDFVIELHAFLKRQNIRMCVYHDMFSPYHSGQQFDLYKMVDKLPKDIIWLAWSGTEGNIRWFHDKGFTVWYSGTGPTLIRKDEQKKMLSGYGASVYGFGHYLRAPHASYLYTQSQQTAFWMGDQAWNLLSGPGLSLKDDVLAGRLDALRNYYAVQPNPEAGERITAVDIAPQMTHSFNDFLLSADPATYGDASKAIDIPSGEQELGLIPMQLGGRADGRNCIVVSKTGTTEVAVPVDRVCSSLIFLHTANIDNPKDPNMRGARGRRWVYGFPCGDYVVEYEGGERVKIPLRFMYNIQDYRPDTLETSTYDNRYVHVMHDSAGKPVCLYQLEWPNPKPHTKIRSVTARHDKELEVSLVWFALSARGLREAGAPPQSRADRRPGTLRHLSR